MKQIKKKKKTRSPSTLDFLDWRFSRIARDQLLLPKEAECNFPWRNSRPRFEKRWTYAFRARPTQTERAAPLISSPPLPPPSRRVGHHRATSRPYRECILDTFIAHLTRMTCFLARIKRRAGDRLLRTLISLSPAYRAVIVRLIKLTIRQRITKSDPFCKAASHELVTLSSARLFKGIRPLQSCLTPLVIRS